MKNNYFSRVFLCTLHNVATHELRNYSAETQRSLGRARNAGTRRSCHKPPDRQIIAPHVVHTIELQSLKFK